MCGRYVDEVTGEVIDSRFRRPRYADPALRDAPARYNVAPMSRVRVIASEPDGERLVRAMQWWLIPPIADDPTTFAKRYTTFNARADKLSASPFYRHAFRHRRCVLPMSGFYEWQSAQPGNAKAAKTPFYIHPTDEPCWAVAGIWERWERPGHEPIDSCAIVTCGATPFMAAIHNAKPADPRMPVILDDAALDCWLDPSEQDPAQLVALLQPYPEARMRAHAVAKLAGDGPQLIAPVR